MHLEFTRSRRDDLENSGLFKKISMFKLILFLSVSGPKLSKGSKIDIF